MGVIQMETVELNDHLLSQKEFAELKSALELEGASFSAKVLQHGEKHVRLTHCRVTFDESTEIRCSSDGSPIDVKDIWRGFENTWQAFGLQRKT